ncbi:S1C family serine protease [Pseudomarimonas salicorniae]|uniref:Trypsin-like peptidase domain-containing protein n=1 Tax=Pseudomarimonas salicorniae TaxID=2933270 RepID=A0ABT0GL44_9GAMM|nr:trypsin-like peptidase domain-containing protein [Lysobacter sp. CAU 1642]MCK7595254.1 trypsin-like peptidase domain-containing protein [Lysobacter sp. CAU 1642]
MGNSVPRAIIWVFWALVGAWLLTLLWPAVAPRPEATPRTVSPRGDLAADEQSTIALFEAAKDSVVFISTRQNVRDYWTRNVMSVPRGNGSGFVWDERGHVVTNWHVIDGASEATVRLSNGRDYRAALVGASPDHDIAVLRIGVGFEPPPPVPVGSSADLRVGQKVFAIGNPFGLDWTLTTGIVSALDRSLPAENGRSIEHLIQTDAAINPGNSGGPLLDSAGRLIGINTAIFSPSGASAGIGFAVPVDTVNRVVPQLISSGRYLRPVLGIEVHAGLNDRLSRETGVRGVFVLGVQPDSAAARAGLRGALMRRDGGLDIGDAILAVNGREVDSLDELFASLDEHEIGSTVTLRIWRQGNEIELPVELQAGSTALSNR